jgi:hypothetical protein
MGVPTRMQPGAVRAATLAVCLLAVSACGGSSSPAPSAPRATSPAALPAAASSAAVADVLAGAWTTRGPVTCEQMDAAIVHGGFTREQRDAIGTDPAVDDCPAAIAISFRDGKLTVNINGEEGWGPGPYRMLDEHTFEAGDDCSYCVRYQFELASDELRIDVVNDDDPGGLGDFIIQTALYESVPFERVR